MILVYTIFLILFIILAVGIAQLTNSLANLTAVIFLVIILCLIGGKLYSVEKRITAVNQEIIILLKRDKKWK